MISLTAVVGIIGAVTTLIVGVIGKLKIDQARSQTNDVTIKKPVPELEVITHERPDFVTHELFTDHMLRIERTFVDIKAVLDKERDTARTSNGNVHRLIDAMAERLGERLANLEGTAKATNETVGKLLDMAMGKKTTPR